MKNNAIAKPVETPIPSAEAQVAAQLTDQYHQAVSCTREVLKLGAMFMGLRVVLQSQNNFSHGPQMKGEGLQGWIEQNCPQINYNTAYKFYGLAKRMREELAIPATTDIYRLLTAPVNELSKKEAKIRVEMDDAIEGKSAYQLELGWGIRKKRLALPASGGSREGSGRPKNTLEREQLEIEATFSKEVLGRLGVAILEKRWHIRLSEEKKTIMRGIALAIAEDLCSPELRSAIRSERERDLLEVPS